MLTAKSTSTNGVFAPMRPCQCQCQIHTNKAVTLSVLLHRRPVLRTAAFNRHRGQASKRNQRSSPCPCRASSEDDTKTSNDSSVVKKSEGRISTTLAGLDALLGIQEETKDEEEQNQSQASLVQTSADSIIRQKNVLTDKCHFRQDAGKSDKVTLDVSPEVLKSIAQADLGRKSAQNGSSKGDKDAEKKLSDQMVLDHLVAAFILV